MELPCLLHLSFADGRTVVDCESANVSINNSAGTEYLNITSSGTRGEKKFEFQASRNIQIARYISSLIAD